MTNLEKYTQAFVDVFGVSADEAKTLEYQSIKNWDSVGHMALMAQLEEVFEIMMEADDIVDFHNFEVGKDILRKYDVEI